jgi:tetratricopeptide (TPR) repeat protein
VKIFVSHSRVQAELAKRLALSVRGDGHKVFFDQSDIEAGEEYDSKIRNEIEACDLFVFLISPESIAADSYPLAELGMAEKRWPVPKDHVLPLVAQPVPVGNLPPYLRAVSVFDPKGDFVAESSAAIARIAKAQRGIFRPATVAVAAIVLVALFAWGYIRFQHARDVHERVTRVIGVTNSEVEAHEYSDAFRTVSAALSQLPGQGELQKAQQQVAMVWLRNIRVRTGEETFSKIVSQLRPVLASGALTATGEAAGDLLAHLGWCEYLRARDGEDHADPISYFKKAVDADRSNPYAHSMWAFWILFNRGALTEAEQHFQLAVMANRERSWVRNDQINALLLNQANEREAVRTANTMRLEQTPVDEPDRLWFIYEEALLRQVDTEEFLNLMTPAEHIATFKWLFPDPPSSDTKLSVYKFLLGRLEEAAGDREYALSAYRGIEDEFRRSQSTGSLLVRAVEGIKRLDR